MKKMSFFLLLLILPILLFSQEETLKVLNGWYKYDNVEHALYHHYLSKSVKVLEKRKNDISKLKTIDDWLIRQKKVRTILTESIGSFPKKTPLNARLLGVSVREDYRIEKVVFESRKNYLVPGALYIPNNLNGKVPAILLPMGHKQASFRAKHYQRSAINLVKKGFVVFTYDPIGQGERLQYFSTEESRSLIGSGCLEHMYSSMPIMLTGRSLANYFVWDGIRALDFLLTREEVDPQRIGITGLSGGATATTFGAAFDDRIKAAAPSCFISGMKRIFESIGPQGPEQNLIGSLARGIEYPDYLEVRIPKPFLILTTTRDFFSIQGARETEAEIRKVYKIFGVEDKFSISEDDSVHAITYKNREARHAFFQKSFAFPGDSSDVEIGYELDEELQITKSGQISSSFDCETIFDVNKIDAERLIAKLNHSRKNPKKHLKVVAATARDLCGYITPENYKNPIFNGRYNRAGYSIERCLIDGEDGDYPIPFLLFIPKKINGAPIVYLDNKGKDANGEESGEIEMLVKQGHVVIAIDLIGIGEMKQQSKKVTFGEKGCYGSLAYSNFFAGVQLNRSIVGIQAGDIERVVMFIKKARWFKGKDLYAIAKGQLLCTSLLHAEVFEHEFSKIAIIDPLISYRSIVMNKYYYSEEYPPYVVGALNTYDLPDLVASVMPKALLMVNIRNHMNNIASEEEIKVDYNAIKAIYSNAGNKNNLIIKQIKEASKINTLVERFLN